MADPVQLPLVPFYMCDHCRGVGLATDRETGLLQRCKVCSGRGQLEYQPPAPGESPFAGLETQT